MISLILQIIFALGWTVFLMVVFFGGFESWFSWVVAGVVFAFSFVLGGEAVPSEPR